MSVARNFRRRRRRRRRLLRRGGRQGTNSFAPCAANAAVEETVLVLVLVKGSHDREVRVVLVVVVVVVMVGMTPTVAVVELSPYSTPVHRVHSAAAVVSPVRVRRRGRGGVLVGLRLVVVVVAGGNGVFARGRRSALRLFLCLHPSVLEPDLDLALGEAQGVGDLDAASPGQVAVVVELLLQLEGLVSRVGLSRSLWTVLTQF